MLFKTKKKFKLQFSSEILKCKTKNCLDCDYPCELMKRKDIRFIVSGKSTGSARWDALLDKIRCDNISITRADKIDRVRKYHFFILEGWFTQYGFTFDFEIQFDTVKDNGWINIIGG